MCSILITWEGFDVVVILLVLSSRWQAWMWIYQITLSILCISCSLILPPNLCSQAKPFTHISFPLHSSCQPDINQYASNLFHWAHRVQDTSTAWSLDISSVNVLCSVHCNCICLNNCVFLFLLLYPSFIWLTRLI